jgi:hypothetical protein
MTTLINNTTNIQEKAPEQKQEQVAVYINNGQLVNERARTPSELQRYIHIFSANHACDNNGDPFDGPAFMQHIHQDSRSLIHDLEILSKKDGYPAKKTGGKRGTRLEYDNFPIAPSEMLVRQRSSQSGAYIPCNFTGDVNALKIFFFLVYMKMPFSIGVMKYIDPEIAGIVYGKDPAQEGHILRAAKMACSTTPITGKPGKTTGMIPECIRVFRTATPGSIIRAVYIAWAVYASTEIFLSRLPEKDRNLALARPSVKEVNPATVIRAVTPVPSPIVDEDHEDDDDEEEPNDTPVCDHRVESPMPDSFAKATKQPLRHFIQECLDAAIEMQIEPQLQIQEQLAWPNVDNHQDDFNIEFGVNDFGFEIEQHSVIFKKMRMSDDQE